PERDGPKVLVLAGAVAAVPGHAGADVDGQDVGRVDLAGHDLQGDVVQPPQLGRAILRGVEHESAAQHQVLKRLRQWIETKAPANFPVVGQTLLGVEPREVALDQHALHVFEGAPVAGRYGKGGSHRSSFRRWYRSLSLHVSIIGLTR